jgi:hypothetical protein
MTFRAAAALVCASVLCAGPATAEERISLAKVKRENRAHVRDLQCFDTCLSWDVKYCKRVGALRARCVARVVFTDHAGTTQCRIINRWKKDREGTRIYEISKRCRPA